MGQGETVEYGAFPVQAATGVTDGLQRQGIAFTERCIANQGNGPNWCDAGVG